MACCPGARDADQHRTRVFGRLTWRGSTSASLVGAQPLLWLGPGWRGSRPEDDAEASVALDVGGAHAARGVETMEPELLHRLPCAVPRSALSAATHHR